MEKKIEEKGGKKEEEVGDFFFQAEDGIRDRDVTGVQTCALPICGSLCYLRQIVFPFCGKLWGSEHIRQNTDKAVPVFGRDKLLDRKSVV